MEWCRTILVFQAKPGVHWGREILYYIQVGSLIKHCTRGNSPLSQGRRKPDRHRRPTFQIPTGRQGWVAACVAVALPS